MVRGGAAAGGKCGGTKYVNVISCGHQFTQELINEMVLWKVNRYVSPTAKLLRDVGQLRCLKPKQHRATERKVALSFDYLQARWWISRRPSGWPSRPLTGRFTSFDRAKNGRL